MSVATRNRLQGLGDFSFKAAIADAAAGGDLDKLNSAIGKFHDALVGAYSKLDQLERAKKALDETAASVNMTTDYGGGIVLPSAAAVELGKGYEAVASGYRSLVAFHFVAGSIIETLQISADALRPVYGGVDGLVLAYYNWNDTMGKRVWGLTYTGEFFQRLQGEKWRIWVADTGLTGGYDYSDTRYVQSAKKAVEAQLGIEVSRDEAGLGELLSGVVMVIVAIAAVIVVIALVVGAVKVTGELNYKAKAIHEERVAYDARMEAQRLQFFEQRQAEGADAATIQREWQDFKSSEDEEQKKREEELAKVEGAGDLFGDFAKIAMLGVGAFLLIHLIPMLKGRS